MKGKQMTLAKGKMARKVKLAILGTLLIVVASTALVIAASTTGLFGGTVDNSGELSPAGAIGSPLVVIRHNSMWLGGFYLGTDVGGTPNNSSEFEVVSQIEWATLYGVSNTNSFLALNQSAIVLFNNSSEILYPAWQVVGLPTGYELRCYVAVRVAPTGTNPPQLSWSGGYLWKQDDYMAFTLKPKDFVQSDFYRLIFVLSASETAIPGPMNFQIQFAYSTTPT